MCSIRSWVQSALKLPPFSLALPQDIDPLYIFLYVYCLLFFKVTSSVPQLHFHNPSSPSSKTSLTPGKPPPPPIILGENCSSYGVYGLLNPLLTFSQLWYFSLTSTNDPLSCTCPPPAVRTSISPAFILNQFIVSMDITPFALFFNILRKSNCSKLNCPGSQDRKMFIMYSSILPRNCCSLI